MGCKDGTQGDTDKDDPGKREKKTKVRRLVLCSIDEDQREFFCSIIPDHIREENYCDKKVFSLSKFLSVSLMIFIKDYGHQR